MWAAIFDVLFPAQCAGCNAFGSGLCTACAPLEAVPVRVSMPGLAITGYGCYEGVPRAAVLALKDGRRDVAAALGQRIAALVPAGFALVPVPTTAKRRRARGFDGVTALARAAGALAGAPVVEALTQRIGDAQRGRSRGERLSASGRFTCDAVLLRGRRVTLIDDVCTTGSTLADCARAVAASGGIVEGAVVVAVTKTPDAWNPPTVR